MMRRYVKRFAAIFLIPLVQWYLRKERQYTFGDINIAVWPGVFHPGFFYSTKFILRYLNRIDLSGKRVLELGCGTGLISIAAAKAGATTTASDLSKTAIENTIQNAAKNDVKIHAYHSNLFDTISERFDLIVINPPYYARDAVEESMLAWNCGKNFEYFEKLFQQLSDHIYSSSRVIMVLTKACDRDSIFAIAARAGFRFDLIEEKKVLFDEKDYLYSVVANSSV